MGTELNNNDSVNKKGKGKSKPRSSLVYEGRTHKSHCVDCGKPFAPDEFTIHDGKRYENYCKPCYNERKDEYRKSVKKKKAIPKKALKSRANNNIRDLDDFTTEMVSIETSSFDAVTRSLLTNLVDDIFNK